MGLKSRLRVAARRWRMRRRGDSGEAVVLAYHRVFELEFYPQWLSVPPDLFAAHLALLRERYHPLSFTALLDGLQKGRLPQRSVVLTFDDGYADNLLQAKPLLEKFDVPATVFVTTGKLDHPFEFWWDELESILFGAAALPDKLSLTIGGQEHSWHLPRLLVADPKPAQPSAVKAPAKWNLTASDPTPRHRLYRLLAPLLRELAAADQEAVLERLAKWAGVARHTRPTHRTLQPDELRRLAAGGLVEIGAHTVTHPVLARQPPNIQTEEITGSRRRLEELLGQPVRTFSYPFGDRNDYNAESVSLVRAAGFRGACANFPELVWRETDPFQVPRFLVRDWDVAGFGRHLEEWFRG